MRAKGLGADVIAHGNRPGEGHRSGDGWIRVMPMAEAVKEGDVYITVTGNKSVIRGEHFEKMKAERLFATPATFNVRSTFHRLRSCPAGRRKFARSSMNIK